MKGPPPNSLPFGYNHIDKPRDLVLSLAFRLHITDVSPAGVVIREDLYHTDPS